jgi:hypothetical protein
MTAEKDYHAPTINLSGKGVTAITGRVYEATGGTSENGSWLDSEPGNFVAAV